MEATKKVNSENEVSALDRPLGNLFTLNWASVLFIGILLVTVISRYAMLGERVMSHDETSHVYFSWLLEQGRGYKHDPITHGPLQFHLMALSYFLFGDNDFSARIPHALASILTVVFMWNYRRYLGRVGWLVAAFLLLISPYMLYYGRYARNEAFVALFTVIGIWAVLRYFDTGASRYLYWFTAATVLHFTSKETAFIFAAQMLIFLALYFLFRITQTTWARPANRLPFAIALLLGVLLLGGALAALGTGEASVPQAATPAVYPAPTPGVEAAPGAAIPLLAILLAGLGVVGLIAALYFIFQGYTIKKIRSERSFDLLILLGTLVLPMLAPFLMKLIMNPLITSIGMIRTSLFLIWH
jgi:4-amino-4-deoxy-L-arabinose transferase-like glycosyltransferase